MLSIHLHSMLNENKENKTTKKKRCVNKECGNERDQVNILTIIRKDLV